MGLDLTRFGFVYMWLLRRGTGVLTDFFSLSVEQYGLILGMFVRSNLARDRATLTSVLEFAIEVADGYKSNPYHSFLHAVDVTYIMYWTLTDMGIAEQLQLNKMELVALLIAALTHDVLHPGLNNLYQVSVRDNWYILMVR